MLFIQSKRDCYSLKGGWKSESSFEWCKLKKQAFLYQKRPFHKRTSIASMENQKSFLSTWKDFKSIIWGLPSENRLSEHLYFKYHFSRFNHSTSKLYITFVWFSKCQLDPFIILRLAVKMFSVPGKMTTWDLPALFFCTKLSDVSTEAHAIQLESVQC